MIFRKMKQGMKKKLKKSERLPINITNEDVFHFTLQWSSLKIKAVRVGLLQQRDSNIPFFFTQFYSIIAIYD